jgi:hypothetical protein
LLVSSFRIKKNKIAKEIVRNESLFELQEWHSIRLPDKNKQLDF